MIKITKNYKYMFLLRYWKCSMNHGQMTMGNVTTATHLQKIIMQQRTTIVTFIFIFPDIQVTVVWNTNSHHYDHIRILHQNIFPSSIFYRESFGKSPPSDESHRYVNNVVIRAYARTRNINIDSVLISYWIMVFCMYALFNAV